MSYLGTDYSRRVACGKTIKSISKPDKNNDCITMIFTDGTYLKIYPHTDITQTYNSISWQARIILTGYYKNNKVISSINIQESLTLSGYKGE